MSDLLILVLLHAVQLSFQGRTGWTLLQGCAAELW